MNFTDLLLNKNFIKNKKNLLFSIILQEKLSKCTACLVDPISPPFPQHCILMCIIISVAMNPHEEGTMHGKLYENKTGYTVPKIIRNNKTQGATIEIIDICFLLTV